MQNKVVPNISGEGGPPSTGSRCSMKSKSSCPIHILPTHSTVDDGSLVAKEKAFIVDLRTRAFNLKKQGVEVEQAGRTLTHRIQGEVFGLADQPPWRIS